MSTPKRKKEQRQREMQREAKIAKYNKMRAASKKIDKEFKEYVPAETYHPDQPIYPSLKTTQCNTARPGEKYYTGDLLVGIGTLHKSNLVPVMRGTDQAIEIATMRRN